MINFLSKVFLCLFISVTLFIGTFYIIFFAPPIYARSYNHALALQKASIDKMSPDTTEIVVVGGSNAALSINTVLLSEEMKMPAKISGIHGGAGVTVNFEILRGNIGTNDIIVYEFLNLDPEIIGGYLLLSASEGNKDFLFSLLKDKKIRNQVILEANAFMTQKLKTLLKDYISGNSTADEPAPDIYSLSSFDENGNMTVKRDAFQNYNYKEGLKISAKKSEIYTALINYLNEFYDYCESKGAKLYMTFSPVYDESVTETKEEILEYETFLRANLKAPFVSTFNENALPKKYIFDNNYHCNTEGSNYYTKKLADDIKHFTQ